ncbi:MAG: general stress protein [Alphaproteobacteria bacterium]|nr:MAG: general stress protein [Alphaproteobacteria bacterium]
MASHDDTDRVWALMEKIAICMLGTRDGEWIRTRPMAADVRRDENAVYFLTDVRRHKDDEIRQFPNVCLAFAETGGQKYVSVTGRATVSNDRARIRELFTTPAKAWWDSADDPNIRVLAVTPHDAEYWDGPGTIVSTINMAAAAATGTRPDLGENRKVAM